MNTLWPFLGSEEISGALKSLKREKINGKQLLVLKYHVPGSRGVELYFDPATFHHVASRFRVEVFRDDSPNLLEKERVTL